MAGNRRRLQGTVVSNLMEKSIVVETVKAKRHRVYKRSVIRKKRYMAHDPESSCQIGDLVVIEESRPISRRKTWRLRQIVRRAEVAVEEETPSLDTATV